MKSAEAIVLLVLTASTVCVTTIPSETESPLPNEQGYVIPGIRTEYLPSPVFYEGYIPVVLEYQTPQWNKSELTFNNWYTCTSDTYPYKYSCPIAFHMNRAVVPLHIDFEGLLPIIDQDTTQSEEAQLIQLNRLTNSAEFCTTIQKHFRSIYMDKSHFEKYLDVLNRCNLHWTWNWSENYNKERHIIVERNLSDFNYGFRGPFTKMENNFYYTFYKNINSVDGTNASSPVSSTPAPSSNSSTQQNVKLDLVASALLSNARTTLQATILGVYYAEKNRWIHANSDCLQQRIPQSIVTRDKLNKTLQAIENMSIFKKGEVELSIHSSFMSKYYTLPLTDCSHSSADSLVVRMQIPFMRKGRSKSLQLVHIHNIPFEYKGHVCRIKLGSQSDHSPSGFLHDMHGTHFLYDEFLRLAFPTDCKSQDQLCKVSEYTLTKRSSSDRCASALMSRDHSVIKSHCQFQCRKQDLTETPIITRIHSNQYVLTGSPANVTVNCARGIFGTFWHRSSYYLQPNRIGAHLVNLPCDCAFSIESADKLRRLSFYGEGPCADDKQKAETSQNKSVTNYSDLDEIEVYSIPNLVPIIPFHFAKIKAGGSHESGSFSFYYENLQPKTLVNLADFIDVGRVEKYLTQKNGGDAKRGGNIFTGEDGVSDVDHILVADPSVTALWVFVIISVSALFLLQGYILFILKKNQVSYPKEDRILYKVPDSPVMY